MPPLTCPSREHTLYASRDALPLIIKLHGILKMQSMFSGIYNLKALTHSNLTQKSESESYVRLLGNYSNESL